MRILSGKSLGWKGFCVGEFLGEMLDVLKDENSLRKNVELSAGD